MSVDAAARYLGISRSHAYDLVRSGELPHVRLGRRIIIPTRDLDALLNRAAHRPGGDLGQQS
jgi:excisionase family DNA binding protein